MEVDFQINSLHQDLSELCSINENIFWKSHCIAEWNMVGSPVRD
jgi:hypothetical protein